MTDYLHRPVRSLEQAEAEIAIRRARQEAIIAMCKAKAALEKMEGKG